MQRTALVLLIALSGLGLACNNQPEPNTQIVNQVAHQFLVAQHQKDAREVCRLSLPRAWWWSETRGGQADCVRAFQKELRDNPRGGITGEGFGDFEAIGHSAKTSVQGSRAFISFPTDCANQPMQLVLQGGKWFVSRVQHYYCTGLVQK